MKKLLVFLLIAALLVGVVPLTIASASRTASAPVGEGGVFVAVDGTTYRVSEGETFDYVYYLNVGGKVCTLDGELRYDSAALELVLEEDAEIEDLFPIANGVIVVNDEVAGELPYNYSFVNGKVFATDKAELIRATFRVTASSGTYAINNTLINVMGPQEEVFIKDGAVSSGVVMRNAIDGKTPYDPENPDGTLSGEESTAGESISEDESKPDESQPDESAPDQPESTFSDIPEGYAFVKADGVTYRVPTGEEIEYVYYLNIGERLCSLDAELFYDAAGLTLICDWDDDIEELFPIIGGGVTPGDPAEGYFSFNYSHSKGKKFNTDDCELVHAKFRVIAAGEFEINTFLHVVAGEGEKRFIYQDEVLIEPTRFGALAGKTPYDPENPDGTLSGEESTAGESIHEDESEPDESQPDESVPDSTAPASAAMVFVKADGVTYRVRMGEIFEYVYCLNIGEKLCSIDSELFFDTAGLQLQIDDDIDEIFPILGSSPIYGGDPEEGVITFNYSNARGKKFNADDCELIRARFLVTAESGEYEINTIIHVLAGENEKKFIYQDEVRIESTRFGAIAGKAPYDPNNPDATLPVEESTAGETIPEEESIPDESNSEDETLSEDPSVPDAPQGVFVKADGVTYRVRQGEVFEYVYYLNVGEKVCSLDSELIFDPDGLELQIEEDLEEIFPIVGSSAIFNDESVEEGVIPFNYSHTKGKKFDSDDCELVHARFRVTAESGEYAIDTLIHVVAGASEKKFIYRDEVLIPPLRSSGTIPGKKPYVPGDPEPVARLLTDEATGVRVETFLEDVELSVTAVPVSTFNYYLFNADTFRIYDVALVRDGAPVELDEPVSVFFPVTSEGAVYRFSKCEFTPVPTTPQNDDRVAETAVLGRFFGVTNSAAPRASLYGDVDGDGDITIVDASFIQRDLASIHPLDSDHRKIADVDGDGDITIVDATFIQRWLAALPSPMDRLGY